MNRDYYQATGPRAWGQVPEYVTTCAWQARVLAQLVVAWMRDLGGSPVTVLEVGGGSGQLAFRLLQALDRFAPEADWTYLYTDLAEANVRAVADHPRLAPWTDAGRLRAQRWDLEQGTPASDRPVVVIGSYLLDSIGQDLYEVTDDGLWELWAAVDVPDGEPPALDTAELTWSRHTPRPGPWDPLLEVYRQEVRGLVSLPTLGMDMVERIVRSAPEALFLFSDKGPHRIEGLGVREHGGLEPHGSVSMAVNFHAVAWWCEHLGGTPLLADHPGDGLNLVGLLHGRPGPELRRAFDLWSELDTAAFQALRQVVLASDVALGRRQLLAWMRLCGHEPLALRRVVAHVERLWLDGSLSREELRRLLERVEDATFEEGAALGRVMGQLWYRVGDWGRAVRHLGRALESEPGHAAAWSNLGACFLKLGQLDLAAEAVAEALRLEPDLRTALLLRDRIARAAT